MLPRGAALRISRERRNSTEETEPSTVRRITERFIPPGATVSVVGRRRDLGEAIEALRRDASIAPDALRRLLDAGSVPCFFDDGIEPFMVADKAFAALKADAVESADAIFWAGAAVFAMSLFVGAAALLGLI